MLRSYLPSRFITLGLCLIAMSGFVMGQGPLPEGVISTYEHHNIFGESIDLSVWRPDFSARCYLPGGPRLENESADLVEELIDALEQEPALGNYLLANAAKYGTVFCVDDKADGIYSYYDLKLNVLSIKAHLDFYEQLIFFVHELRHLDAASRGFCPSLEYDVQEMSRLTLASEADAQAVTTLYAWRMKLNGEAEVWPTLAGLDLYGDIALAFEQEMARSGDEVSATRAAVEQWYASKQRVFSYHLQACLSYLDALEASHKLQSYEPLPEDFFDELCVLGAGDNYGCHHTEVLQSRSD